MATVCVCVYVRVCAGKIKQDLVRQDVFSCCLRTCGGLDWACVCMFGCDLEPCKSSSLTVLRARLQNVKPCGDLCQAMPRAKNAGLALLGVVAVVLTGAFLPVLFMCSCACLPVRYAVLSCTCVCVCVCAVLMLLSTSVSFSSIATCPNGREPARNLHAGISALRSLLPCPPPSPSLPTPDPHTYHSHV